MKLFLAIGISYPLALLIIFKYFNFFSRIVTDIARLFHLNYPPYLLKFLIPIGISFYTLQCLSYIIDIYRKNQNAERHFGYLLLFIIFFPRIVAGPIERADSLIPQFKREVKLNYQDITDGIKILAWGFFKKLVIADRAAIIVNQVFAEYSSYWGLHYIIAALLFSIQLYCDFSGYTDIAIGTGRILGFRLSENFRRPFLAPSIRELWRRWHISLVDWLREYIYFPLGGNRNGSIKWQRNLFITFLISGFWHGGSWTFIAWAVLHILFVLFSFWTQKIREWTVRISGLGKLPRLHRIFRSGITFLLFSLAGIFFRARTITEAIHIVTNLFSRFGEFLRTLSSGNIDLIKSLVIVFPHRVYFLGFTKPQFLPEMIVLVLAIIGLFIVEIVQERGTGLEQLNRKPWYIRWVLYYLVLFSILFLGVISGTEFIYGYK